ncbi:MAG TPA: PDGLE domain-containing protein [Pilimelia sp.]|nr:PDGLE domain-containing protein [Pilimelia sp.]
MSRATRFVLGGLLVSLLLAGVVSSFASAAPDGLDSASTKGCTTDEAGEITGGSCMARNAKDHELAGSPLADYALRGVADERLATGLSGVAGVLLTFAVGGGLFWLARRRRPEPAAADPAGADPAGG